MSSLPSGKNTMSSALPDALNYHAWIIELLKPFAKGKVLEIGAGFGQYSEYLIERVEKLTVVDLDSEVVANIQRAMPKAEAKIADLCAEDFCERVGKNAYDVVVCLNVLEHIENDTKALENMRASLKPGGKLLLFVPAHAALYGDMDRLAGHFRRYRKSSLCKKLIQCGYHVLTAGYFNPIGGVGWWVQARFRKAQSLSSDSINRQIIFFDRYLVPLSRILNPLTRFFFGQSLWIVVETPSE